MFSFKFSSFGTKDIEQHEKMDDVRVCVARVRGCWFINLNYLLNTSDTADVT